MSNTKGLVIEMLRDGYSIDYAFVTGDLGMFKHGHEPYGISIIDFLDLRESKIIIYTETVYHSHPLFHGSVQIYRLKEEDQ